MADLQTNPSSAQSFPRRWVDAVINTRMFHQEPDHEIMVQLNQVYIYKLWDVFYLMKCS